MSRIKHARNLALALLLLFPAAGSLAQAEDSELRVGTYNLQQVFQTLELGRHLEERMASLQLEAHVAQQEGDEQRLQEIQQEAQQAQQQLITDFRGTLERVTPQVAEEHGVQVVAADIIYTAPEADVVDLTDQVIRAMQVERE